MRTADGKGFFLCLFWNAFLFAGWTVPAWVLLALHFALHIPILWFWLAIGLWFAAVLFRTLLIVWTRYCVRRHTPSPVNKNPYSQKARDPYAAVREQQSEQRAQTFFDSIHTLKGDS